MRIRDVISEQRHRAMRVSGIVIWLILGLPAIDAATRNRLETPPASWTCWIGSFVLFGISYYFGSVNRRLPPILRINALALQSASVVAMTLSFRDYFTGFLLVLTAWQAAVYLSSRTAWVWAALQTVATVVALEPHWHMGWRWAVTSSVIGLEVFALTAGVLLGAEAAGRDDLLLLNIELGSTRELLRETSRAAERLHIARELHDVLGHHLAALSLRLEHAVHVAKDPVKGEIERAQSSARQMLSEVRSVVSAMRSDGGVDLVPALNAIAQRMQKPRLHLEVPPDFLLPDRACAHAILRCIQEVATNAIKHSGADNLWVSLRLAEGTIEVSAWDDGRLKIPPHTGSGLAGMRERFESLGGGVRFETAPNLGFAIRARLPFERRNALS